MTIPIIGQNKQEFQCIRCLERVDKVTLAGNLLLGFVCVNGKCIRFGLVSAIAKDPSLTLEEPS